MTKEEARAEAERLFLYFATRRTEKRKDEPEEIVVFCMLGKDRFIEWAAEFFEKSEEGGEG